ncbi:uncharacterized protein V6R79_000477 [Siganus canaliculatus]
MVTTVVPGRRKREREKKKSEVEDVRTGGWRDKAARGRGGKVERYGDASGTAAVPGSGVSAVGKGEHVRSPSASSWLFSERHSPHYQSKCIKISAAHRYILHFAHLIGKDSHEQNGDATGLVRDGALYGQEAVP